MSEFTFEEAVGYVVNRAALRLKAALQRAFRESGYDVTAEQWAVLNCLWTNEGMTQTEIAERVAKDKTNLTRILDVMERNGLITRQRHESDRRSYRVFPTREAWNIREDLTAAAEVVSRTATRGLSAADQREIVRLMNIITSNLSE